MAESTWMSASQLRETVHILISRWAQGTHAPSSRWFPPRPAPSSQPVSPASSMWLFIRGCTCPLNLLLPPGSFPALQPTPGNKADLALWLLVGRIHM